MGQIKQKALFLGLKKSCHIAGKDVKQQLHKNAYFLFKDFQGFLRRKQQVP